MSKLTKRRIIVVPRLDGSPEDDWYPWLTEQLGSMKEEAYSPIEVVSLHNRANPDIGESVRQLIDILGASTDEIGRTILVGHSIGCQIILRTLQRMNEGKRIAGALLVAAWLEIDHPWDIIQPWIEEPIDVGRVLAASEAITVLLSDNDPFTSDYVTNRTRWEDEFGASVTIVPGAFHFNERVQPVILASLLHEPARGG